MSPLSPSEARDCLTSRGVCALHLERSGLSMRDELVGFAIAAGSCAAGGVAHYLWGKLHEDPTETGPSGAAPDSELDRFLRLQNLRLEDVEHNRAGRLSPRQAERLHRHTR